ncbi:hypothetical protein EJV46_00565 [Roseococcus sp. SYP-B2431]|uniref:hypothetical protein n=1 Tax=Roseococcus sp. SYP-B2431 TaxID=2496640 RepID=UPI00103A8B50|nr:hypothetical protein [Roseococcus sp. SYP-B2431]TCI00983.1 hypothetical protein EJV46_00565 [Roseococcus sp. SYP-B2431]
MRKIVLAILLSVLAQPVLAQQPPEPAAVTQLRRMLGSGVTLAYGAATATDVQGSAALTALVLTKGAETIRIAEARLEGLREDGIARLSLREIQIAGGQVPATLDRLDLEGLTVRRQPGGAPPKPTDVSANLLRMENWRSTGETPVNIGAINVENFGGGRPGSVNVTALEVGVRGAGPVERVAVARIAVSGLDAAEILGAIMEQRPPATLPGRSSLDIESVTVSQGGNVLGRLGAFTMRGEVAPGRPSTGAFTLRGLEVNPAPPHAEWMQRLDYTSLRAEARMEATHDATTGVLDMPVFSIELRDAGELSLAFRLDNVRENMTQQAAQNMRLISARLRYADLSLFRRWVRTAAQRENMPENAFRQRLAQQATAALSGPSLASARDAAQRFLRGDATVLELAANPRAPLSFGLAQRKPQRNLAGWQDMFGLTLTAR